MFKKVSAVTLFAFVILAGCQKDVAPKANAGSDNLSTDKLAPEALTGKGVVSTNHWYGTYTDAVCSDPMGACDPDGSGDATDAGIIKNGVAQLPNPAGYNFSYGNISFDIPSQYNISGDSLTFVAVVENTIAYSLPDYDVILRIVGDKDTAAVHFVAAPSSQQSTEYYVGTARYTNLPSLVHYFGSFETVKLAQKKYQTGAYVNNKLVYKFAYRSLNSIGRVKTITVSGKGYPTVDNVQLMNSYTNKKLMTEAFNVDGQSHTVFY